MLNVFSMAVVFVVPLFVPVLIAMFFFTVFNRLFFVGVLSRVLFPFDVQSPVTDRDKGSNMPPPLKNCFTCAKFVVTCTKTEYY